MKRYIKRVINWFSRWFGRMIWEEKIGFAFGVILGAIVGIIIFLSFDKVLATLQDYKPLEEQSIVIQQNPELLVETDCNNKSFEKISSSKEDKSTFWLVALGVAIIVAIWICGLGFFALTTLAFLLVAIGELILNSLKSKKNKLKNQ